MVLSHTMSLSVSSSHGKGLFSFIAIVITLLALLPSKVSAGAITAGRAPNRGTIGGQCIRTFHSSGSVGCKSSRDGVSAPLYSISSEADMEIFLTKNEQSIVVIPSSIFSEENLNRMGSRLVGLYIYPDKEGGNPMSLASATPQGKGSEDGALNPFSSVDKAWNPNGQNMLDKLFSFPVLMVNSYADAVETIEMAQSNQEGKSGATYSAEMEHFFGPEDMNSRKCLEFRNIYDQPSPRCDPIGGQSVWSQRGPDLSTNSNASVIMAMTAIDSSAFSHFLAPGASAASDIITLLAAADAIKNIESDTTFEKALVFGLFQGEKYGFVGSRRFLSDITNFQTSSACTNEASGVKSPFGSSFCLNPLTSNLEFAKLSLDKIEHIIAVDQIGTNMEEDTIYLNENPNNAQPGELSQLIQQTSAGQNDTAVVSGLTSLPPSPLLTFLNEGENGRATQSSILLTGYQNEFSNATYLSRYDTTINLAKVEKAALVLAQSMVTLASAEASLADNLNKLKVDSETIKKMADCMTTNWNCELFQDVMRQSVQSMMEYSSFVAGSSPAFQIPPTMYSGVYKGTRQLLLKDSQGSISGFSTDAWKSEDNKVLRLFPNALETFIYSFLSSANGIGTSTTQSAGADALPSCSKTSDCQTGSNVNSICAYPGKCVLRTTYYHNAFSPALKATADPGIFEVLPGRNSDPLWTEPVWERLLNFTYPDPGRTIGWMSVVIGIVVTVVSVFAAKGLMGNLKKHKLV